MRNSQRPGLLCSFFNILKKNPQVIPFATKLKIQSRAQRLSRIARDTRVSPKIDYKRAEKSIGLRVLTLYIFSFHICTTCVPIEQFQS